MANKIFKSIFLAAMIVLLCSAGIIMGVLYDYFDGIQIKQLKNELNLAAVATQASGMSYLETVNYDQFRLTWIGRDGGVLFDSRASTENHADREEIREAFASGVGSSSRYSNTLMEKTMYEAVRLRDGSVLRISAGQATSAALARDMLRPIAVVVVLAAALSAVLAKRMARRIVKPLNELNLEQPLQNDAYEEITPLLQRINQQHLQISAQIETLKRKTDEFEQITVNMNEGLILLDGEDRVVQINPAACQLFETDRSCVGRDFLALDRSREMQHCVNQGFLKGSSQLRTCRGGREYQFEMSRIESGGTVLGAAILAFDVTEQAGAERTRREFSANVSHELKTPLQSIIGSAELLQNGLVRPEDTPYFISNIHREASRLVNLIEDIIRLSELDEQVPLPREQVDLYPMAREILGVLEPAAREKQVQVVLEGTCCRVLGVSRMLYEIIFNLCDNAIKYNVEGGRVTVTLREEAEKRILTVADTGIGIAPEHQSRVFERFYRADKSHSRRSGGTGLGLSIVKHAVMDHDARLSLKSEPGRGTVITVIF